MVQRRCSVRVRRVESGPRRINRITVSCFSYLPRLIGPHLQHPMQPRPEPPDLQSQLSLYQSAQQLTTHGAVNTDQGSPPAILFLVPQPTHPQGLKALL